MKKNDVVIKVNPENRQVYFNDNFLGLNAENLQSNLVFEFDGEFVNGTPRVEIEKDGEKYIITELSKVDDTYVMEIKSSLLTTNVIYMQLVITEVGEEEIPIFKSKRFYLIVEESINADTELPDEYQTLYDQIEEKIAEVDNIDISVSKVEHTATVEVTKKDGITETVDILDGAKGDDYVITQQDYDEIAEIVETNIEPTIDAIETTANTAKSIAEGANQAVSYGNYQMMINTFNTLDDTVYRTGQNLYILTLEIPDLWISSVESTSVAYTYTTDEAFINDLTTNGYVQVGYYRLSALETQKVDLTDYVQFTNYATSSIGGVIKTGNGLNVSSGTAIGVSRTYEQFSSDSNNYIISKGTLENVITGKQLVNKQYVDNLVGNINTTLETLVTVEESK